MLFLLLNWLVMAGVALLFAQTHAAPMAILWWAGFAGVACTLAALALQQQPLEQSTFLGRSLSGVLRWGYGAGRGRLPAITLISWGIWCLIGAALIGVFQHRHEPMHAGIVLAWLVDLLALLYLAGTAIEQRRLQPSLRPVIVVLLGMLLFSAFLWFDVATPAARWQALLVAGGPPLFLGGGYALFLLVVLTVGRGARWN